MPQINHQMKVINCHVMNFGLVYQFLLVPNQPLAQKPVSGWATRANIWAFVFTFVAMDPWSLYPRNLFEPCWKNLKPGDEVSVVVELQLWDTEMSLAKLVPSGFSARIIGSLDKSIQTNARVTLFCAHVDLQPPYIDLLLTSQSHVVVHPVPCLTDLSNVVEFCAGAAASSVGLSAAGFTHACSVEWSPKFVSLHERLHPAVPVICGDISDIDVLIQVKSIVPGPFSLMLSCQPFSVGGSQKGGFDPRASTLPATLRAAHLFQCALVILECVVPARTDEFVRQHLRAFHDELGYAIHDEVYNLEHIWCAKRFRWWVVATHKSIGQVPLDPYPGSLSPLKVQDLMPYPKAWPQTDMEQLMLQPHEELQFQMDGSLLKRYMVKMDEKLPTALHSWGNQCQACECGCRSQGFSPDLLLRRGIFTQLMPVRTNQGLKFRHMHCQEVALLNGFPPNQDWSENARLNLAAMGQMASPLQSVWVGAMIIKHLSGLLQHELVVQPVQILWNYKRLLLQQAKQLFPDVIPKTPAVAVPTFFTTLSGLTFSPVQVQVQPTTTLAQLLRAEADVSCSAMDHWIVVDLETMTWFNPWT